MNRAKGLYLILYLLELLGLESCLTPPKFVLAAVLAGGTVGPLPPVAGRHRPGRSSHGRPRSPAHRRDGHHSRPAPAGGPKPTGSRHQTVTQVP